jgi:NAD(P)-dependent dehydrogenase (short-subunit alcohol dehydrogenase family)
MSAAPSEFAGRVVLVTGAGAGIGREFARSLTAAGARVGAIDLRPDALADLAKERAGQPLATAAADVTDAPGLAAAVAKLEGELGPADILIANAGIFRLTSANHFDPADFAAQIQVNLIGVANSFAAVLPGMKKRRAGQLVAISSLASYYGLPYMWGYCASKAGVSALCEGLRAELAPRGIAVTTVCPGFIKTDIGFGVSISKPPSMMPVEYAVGRMLDAVRRRRAFVAFPATTVWRLRFLRCLPRAVGDWMVLRDFRRAWEG